MSIFLSKDDVIRLTSYTQIKKQRKELEKRGIPYDLNKDGEPLVLKDHYVNKKSVEQLEPNWGSTAHA